MPVSMVFNIIDIKRLTRKFHQLEDKFKTQVIRQSLEQAGSHMETSLKQSMIKQKEPKGKKFPKFHKSYTYRPSDRTGHPIIIGPRGTSGMRKVKKGDKPLINTGQMMASISYSFINNFSIKVGSMDNKNAKKLKKHHFGTSGKVNYIIYPKKKGGKIRKFTRTMKPQKRKVLGFSNWQRHNRGTDQIVIARFFRINAKNMVKAVFG